jgi:hypothetical protein
VDRAPGYVFGTSLVTWHHTRAATKKKLKSPAINQVLFTFFSYSARDYVDTLFVLFIFGTGARAVGPSRHLGVRAQSCANLPLLIPPAQPNRGLKSLARLGSKLKYR